MIRTLIAAAAMSAVAIPLTAQAVVTEPVPQLSPRPKFLTTPCAYEDSVNCYWIARHPERGGQSFFAIRVGKSGVVIRYWDRAYGRKHDKFLPDGW